MASKRSVEEKDLLCEARLRLRKEEVLPHYLNKYETQRDALYEIPSAGSTPTGIMGYFSCMREISDQTESPFDYIFCGNGSGGTYAGLWLGSKFLQIRQQNHRRKYRRNESEKTGFHRQSDQLRG